ncbi:MAG TPA: penicillin-binding protein activator [Syntrophales bacterium]|nr:penicillin-binding protein activator [Syntrophales bacterium]
MKNVFRLFFLFFLGLSLCACAVKTAPRVEEPIPSLDRIPLALQPLFHEAETAYRSGDLEAALPLYETLVKSHPGGTPGALARLRLGEILLEKGDLAGARRELEALGTTYRGDPLYHETQYLLALLALREGDPSRSELLSRELLQEPLSPALKAKTLALVGDSLLAAGNASGAVTYYLLALEERPGEAAESALRGKTEGIVRHGLDENELKALLEKQKRRYPSGYVLVALARLSYDRGDADAARSYVGRFLDGHPGHPLAGEGQDILNRLEKMAQVNRRAVGLILPLSGKFAAFGQKALDAALLALDLENQASDGAVPPMELFIEDSAGEPSGGKKAVEKLVQEDRVMGIIGTMAGDAAEEAARTAQALQVPLVTLTQKEAITETGDFVFRNFLTPPMIMKTLVHFAFMNMGMKRFAILYPDDPYGTEMMEAFWNEVEWYGGEVRGVESYEPNATDFSREIRALAGLPEKKDGQEEEKPSPVVDFDALFIPDTALKARLIAPQLAFHDITTVQLLGSNLWNTPDLLQGETTYLQEAVFVDVFFLDSLSRAVRDFVDRFYFAYGRNPAEIEALAFDTMKILLTLLEDDRIRIREDLRDALLQLKNYPGVTGPTGFDEGGEALKKLFVLSIRGDRIIEVD